MAHRFWWNALACVALFLSAGVANAHKASDAYLQIDATAQGTNVRLDIALRDLEAALDIDTDQDGKLTWAEVKAAWPAIEQYALAGLTISGCPLRADGRALERRNDGAYAVLMLSSPCALPAVPAISYTLLREVDPTHRGIVKLQRSGQPVVLMLLDPTKAAASSGAPAASGAATAPPVTPASAWGFLQDGIHHIVTGYDHVLFLLCLLLPSVMRRTPAGWRPVERLSQAVLPVVGIVSAFTVAHSITLALAA